MDWFIDEAPKRWTLPVELELLVRQAKELPYMEAHRLLFDMVPQDEFMKLWKEVLQHKRPKRKQFTKHLIVELEQTNSQGFTGTLTIHQINQPDDYYYMADVRRIKIRETSKWRFWTRALLIVEAAKSAGW